MPDEGALKIGNATEQRRLDEARERGVLWKQWGPYLSERQWGTVREDYSENGDAWNYFTHDQARAPITGVRTGSPGSATTTSGCASPWRYGTARTRSSRSSCSD
jgi:hypothetical protein